MGEENKNQEQEQEKTWEERFQEMELKLNAALENNQELRESLEKKDKELSEVKKMNFKLAENYTPKEQKKSFEETLLSMMKDVR